jgi:hypothetical protein
MYCIRAADSLAGAWGKFFLGALFFPDNNNNNNNLLPPGRVRCKCFPATLLNFSYQISVLCQKQISCPLHGNISPKKMTGAQQKIYRGPQNLAICPTLLSEALYCINDIALRCTLYRL